MFHFPGCPPMRLWIHLMVTGHYPGRVPPFGYSWINAYLQLPRTFRSLSRPSSAISALASTLRSSSLDLAFATAPLLRPIRAPWLVIASSYLCSFQGAEKEPPFSDSSKRYSEKLRSVSFFFRRLSPASFPSRPSSQTSALDLGSERFLIPQFSLERR